MKKLLLFIFTFLVSLNLYSAIPRSLILQGIVAKKVSITVSANTISSGLDLSTTQNNLIVASVNERSNVKAGYKVNIASANLGKIKRLGGVEVFPYTMKYNGLTLGLNTVAGTTVTSGSSAPVVNINKNISISYTGVASSLMVEGTYTDTLTFTISAN